MGLADHVQLVDEQLNQSAVVESSIGRGYNAERVGPEEDTSQEEHHMAYQGNRGQAEIPDQSAGFAGEDTKTEIVAAGIWEAAAGAD